MEKKLFVKMVGYCLAMVAVMCGCWALVAWGWLREPAFLVAGLVCFPLGKKAYSSGRELLIGYAGETTRRVPRALKKIGFEMEESDWSEDGRTLLITGVYRGDNFAIEAMKNCAYIRVIHMPCCELNYDDTDVPRFLEAVNDINSRKAYAIMVVDEPNEKGKRLVWGKSNTVLPRWDASGFLAFLLTEMIENKYRLRDSLMKEREWMKPRRGPIGFDTSAKAPQAPAAPADDAVAATTTVNCA